MFRFQRERFLLQVNDNFLAAGQKVETTVKQEEAYAFTSFDAATEKAKVLIDCGIPVTRITPHFSALTYSQS